MKLPQLTLRQAISASLIIVIVFLSVIYAFISFHDQRILINQYSSAIFNEKRRSISDLLSYRLNNQAKFNSIAAAAIPSLYQTGGLNSVEAYLYEGLQNFEEIAASFFATTDNEFGGYVKEETILHMYANANTNYSIIFETLEAAPHTIRSANNFLASQRPWYSSALAEGSRGFSNVFRYHAYSTLALPHSLPVYTQSGELLGVVGNNIFLSDLSSLLAEHSRDFDGIAVILDENNNLVAASLGSPVTIATEIGGLLGATSNTPQPFIEAASNMIPVQQNYQCKECDYAVISVNGNDYRVGGFEFKEIQNVSWKINLFIPENRFQKNITDFAVRVALILVFIMLVALFMAIGISRLISMPLTSMIRRYADVDDSSERQEIASHGYELAEVKNLRKASEKYKARISTTISSLKAQEEELLVWKQVFYSTSTGMAISNNNDEYIDMVNPAFARMYGGDISDYKGAEIYSLIAEHEKDKAVGHLQQVTKSGELLVEVQHIRKNGDPFPVLLSSALVRNKDNQVIARVSAVTDLTEIKQMQQELFQSQKTQAIGTLAGGIVHDINNVLGSITGNAELGMLAGTAGSEGLAAKVDKYFSAILKAAKRGSGLTQQVLSFSRMEPMESNRINVTALINGVIELVSPTTPKHIKIDYENTVSSDIYIDGNESQLEQVVLNLLSNSVKAIKKTGKSEGAIKIQVSISEAGLVIMIQDNGCGIGEDKLPFIFDPFYTSESKGQGTGLGLAIVKRIMTAHGAKISVTSKSNAFTKMQLTFAQYFTASHNDYRKSSNQHTQEVENKTQVVLVDDDVELAQTLGELLQIHSFATKVFNDALEARDYCINYADAIDVLITDFDMPGLTGAQLIQSMKECGAKPKTILITGFNEQINQDNMANLAIDRLMIKPVMISDLKLVINELMQQSD